MSVSVHKTLAESGQYILDLRLFVSKWTYLRLILKSKCANYIQQGETTKLAKYGASIDALQTRGLEWPFHSTLCMCAAPKRQFNDHDS